MAEEVAMRTVVPLPDGPCMVVIEQPGSPSPNQAQQLADWVKRTGRDDVMIVFTDIGARIYAIDEATMRAEGWVRA